MTRRTPFQLGISDIFQSLFDFYLQKQGRRFDDLNNSNAVISNEPNTSRFAINALACELLYD